LIALTFLGACSAPAPELGGNVLIYGRGSDAVTLDPADAEDGESVKVITNIFDTLVFYSDDGTDLVPALATSWATSNDGKTWTLQLREGVTFHDGSAMDAAAVAFTFDRLIDPKNEHRYGAAVPYRADYAFIERVEATGTLEVTFHLRSPSGIFLRKLAMFPASIVSPAAVKEKKDRFKDEPIGTGAFAFREWLPGERFTMSANAFHWRGKPALEEVIFKPILEPAARRRQLVSGEIHMADELSIPVRQQLRKDGGVVVDDSPGMNTAYLAMNNSRPPFDDVRVRRAIAHAIDKSAIARSAYEGEGQIATTLIPRAMWGRHEGVEDYPYDPGRARELLAEAGIAPGMKIKFFAMRNSRPYMPSPEQVTAIVLEQLRQVGFDPQVFSPDWAQYLDQVGNGEHDVCLMGWQTDNADPDNFLHALLDKENAHPPKAHNLSFYMSDAVHDLLLEGQRETDQSRRLEIYLKAQEIIHGDCPMVPLMHLDLAVGRRENVVGYRLHPTGLVILRGTSLR
jgi:peptide/nickel transport system substrate-binding protein